MSVETNIEHRWLEWGSNPYLLRDNPMCYRLCCLAFDIVMNWPLRRSTKNDTPQWSSYRRTAIFFSGQVNPQAPVGSMDDVGTVRLTVHPSYRSSGCCVGDLAEVCHPFSPQALLSRCCCLLHVAKKKEKKKKKSYVPFHRKCRDIACYISVVIEALKLKLGICN